MKFSMVRSLLGFIAGATVINICINFRKMAARCGGTMHCLGLGVSQQFESESRFFFENNTQGSIPYPTIRNDAGPLPHKLVATKSVSTPKSCALEGDRTKHVTKSSAASLLWEDVSGQASWEVKNVRKVEPNDAANTTKSDISHILVTENRTQVVKVDKIIAPVTTHDGKEKLSSDSSNITWGAEDPRTVSWNGSPVVIYHSVGERQMWIYHHKSRHPVMLTICGHGTTKVEKNWTPLVVDDGKTFLLLYSIDPLVILQYNIDAGDGVCKLIFGHLPTRGMKSPYGGTPFKEISIPTKIKGIEVRSFLSFAHSRDRGNDSIPQDIQRSRVYRPVALVLHIFCPSDNKWNKARAGMDGCTFGVDIYDLWHEIESPVEVFKSKFAMNRGVSVSYPYDLHIFQQSGMVRIGIEYEDCASVYEDISIDFEVIKDGQLRHPMRLELEEDSNKKEVEFLTHAQLMPVQCPYPGEKVILSPMASEAELSNCTDGKQVWVVSHGGVSSERFRSMIPDLPCEDHASGEKQRPIKGVLAHFPYPLMNEKHAPKLCVYIYGSVYESILSQLRRHPDNAKKLHNDEAYLEFSTLEELLSHPDRDPFGIKNQFEEFLTASVNYPILLVKYDTFHHPSALQKLGSMVSKITGTQYNFTSLSIKDYKRSSSIGSISNSTLREQFVERYSQLNEIFDSQPLLRLIMPEQKIQMSEEMITT